MPKPPVKRQDPFAVSGVEGLEPELKEQLKARRKRSRPKQTYDLPRKLIEAVQQIARHESISQSGFAALALADLVERYRSGELDLSELKRPTRSLRFDYKLELPGEWR